MSIIDGKNVLITGGTGSLGRALCKHILKSYKPAKVIAMGHSELGMDIFKQEIQDARVRLWKGNIEDVTDLTDNFRTADIVIHAAAMKVVEYCEDNEKQSTIVNVLGTQNVIDAAYRTNVQKVVFVSTDKAVAPKNKYGKDKSAAEHCIIGANRNRKQIFSCTRWGNIENSRGSVIPYFKNLKARGIKDLPLRNKDATRFAVNMDEAIGLLMQAVEGPPGLIWVKKSPSYYIMSLVAALECEYHLEHLQSGEKLHEYLLTDDEAMHSFENKDNIIILPDRVFNTDIDYSGEIMGRLPRQGKYSSDDNVFLSVPELKERIAKYD